MHFIKIENALALIGILIALGAWLYPYPSVEKATIEIGNTRIKSESRVVVSDVPGELAITKPASNMTPSVTILQSKPRAVQTMPYSQPEAEQSKSPVINVYGDQNISGDLILGNKVRVGQ